jgi:MHS family proline/betaine transporter-like MFS transporter
MMPAYYLMGTSVVGGIAIFFMRETAGLPLLGSMPSVDSVHEARQLVATQDDNPNLNTAQMPFDDNYEPPSTSIELVVLDDGPELLKV